MKKIIIFIVVILLLETAFVLLSKKREVNIINKELEGIISFALISKNNNNYIVAIKEDGNQVILANISSYGDNLKYDYFDTKLYLYFSKIDSSLENNILESYIGYIDLSNKVKEFKIEILSKIDMNGIPSSIAAFDNNIYISSSMDSYVYKYSIETKSMTKTMINNISIYVTNIYSLNDNLLVYNEDYNINILNIKSNNTNLISNNGRVKYVYKDKIIYYTYTNDNKDKWIYYEYDLNTNKSKKISDELFHNMSLVSNNIVPYNNSYLITNGKDIYIFKNNEYEPYYSLDTNINSMTLISNNKMVISASDPVSSCSCSQKYYNFDIEEKLIDEISNDYYYDILYIK